MNAGLNFTSGSAKVLNFGLNFQSSSRKSSSNFGSGPNFGITILNARFDFNHWTSCHPATNLTITLKSWRRCSRRNAELCLSMLPVCISFFFFGWSDSANLLLSCSHLHVVHVGYFLCRLLMRKVSEHREHVYLEFISRKVELEYVLVFWSSRPVYYCCLQKT